VISNEGVCLGAEAARRLAETGLYEFEPGLTDAKFKRIGREYGFEFADDHRAFLVAGLPVNIPPEDGQTWSRPWPEWRGGDLDSLRRRPSAGNQSVKSSSMNSSSSRSRTHIAAVPRGLLARAIRTVNGGTTRPEPDPNDIAATPPTARSTPPSPADHHKEINRDRASRLHHTE
jgi:hypothetical protein